MTSQQTDEVSILHRRRQTKATSLSGAGRQDINLVSQHMNVPAGHIGIVTFTSFTEHGTWLYNRAHGSSAYFLRKYNMIASSQQHRCKQQDINLTVLQRKQKHSATKRSTAHPAG